jgi:hypothetical protein
MGKGKSVEEGNWVWGVINLIKFRAEPSLAHVVYHVFHVT